MTQNTINQRLNDMQVFSDDYFKQYHDKYRRGHQKLNQIEQEIPQCYFGLLHKNSKEQLHHALNEAEKHGQQIEHDVTNWRRYGRVNDDEYAVFQTFHRQFNERVYEIHEKIEFRKDTPVDRAIDVWKRLEKPVLKLPLWKE